MTSAAGSVPMTACQSVLPATHRPSRPMLAPLTSAARARQTSASSSADGLLPAPPRTSGNYRAYGADHLNRLRFIRRCRDLGFTLDQVRDLLRLSSREDQPCAEVNRISAEHLTEIEHKIADLARLADELR